MREKGALRHAVAAHLRAVRVLHKVSPRFFPLRTFSSLFSAVSPYVTVFFSARILRELATLRRVDVLWRWVLAGVLCVGAVNALGAVLQRRYETLLSDLWGRKEILFIRKMFSLDFSELDKQENHDLRAQIRQNENWASWGLMKVAYVYGDLVGGVIGLLSGIALTVSLFTSPVPETAGWLTALNNPLFVLLLAFLMVSVSILAGKLIAAATKCWSGAAEEATLGNRLFGHFGFIGLHRERADIRMYNQQNLVSAYWDTNSSFGADGPIGRMARGKMGVYAGLGVCVTTLITGSVYVFTCLKAWGGAFDVGSITQYVGAASAMITNIFSLIGLMGTLETNTGFLEQTFAFLDIPNAMYQGSVSFKYPGSGTWALRHVNLKFKVGRRLAIVGENGSGKTTFIKLLCRLYDPQEGQILLNGIDIRKYRYDDYMKLFSVVFQDFRLIAQPLGDNVAGSMEYDRERVRQALTDAGFGDRLDSMPQGLDTMLYKNLSDDGVEISGGEAQKIAIARALYKDAPFIILDEPTAALDPIAEAEIYGKFDEIAGDKTAVYISHRLSSCKFCDEIAVFQDGRIVQRGSHEALVADEEGKYYQLWSAQAQYYTAE